MADKITFEILEDGKVSISTDKISDKHHANADDLLKELQEMLGGQVKIEKKKGQVHQHTYKKQTI